MNSSIKTILALLLTSATHASAQLVTLTTTNHSDSYSSSAWLEIQDYQSLELLSIHSAVPADVTVAVERLGNFAMNITYDSRNSDAAPRPLTIVGPVKVRIVGPLFSPALATFRISPEPYPPTQAAIVPPGLGGARVAFECSTNLVDWAPATSGDYTNQPVAKFFRVKLQKLP